MGKTFKRLLARSKTRAAGRKILGWERRLRRLEEALYESNAYRVREINAAITQRGGTPSQPEADFLASAEDFRRHLTEVLQVNSKEDEQQ